MLEKNQPGRSTHRKATQAYTSSGSGLGENRFGSTPDRRAERRTKTSPVVAGPTRLVKWSGHKETRVNDAYGLSRDRGLEGGSGEFSFGISTTIGSGSLCVDWSSWARVIASHTDLDAGPLIPWD
jgi:hypothetical protein